jgi:hypothetical protein
VKDYSYNFEIKDLLTQFIAAFDDIVIKRYDKDRVAKETIEVRYILAPKQRVMYDIVNKAQNLTLPVVACNITSISRDSTRVFNKLDSIYNMSGDRNRSNLLMPIPINIEVSMSILARYLQDMDQILSNFVPYNNPYIIISWKEPTDITSQTVEIRSEVLWNGSITLTEPTDISYSDKFRVVADTSFTIKGWLFRNRNELSSQIYFIDTNFISTRGNLIVADTNYDTFFNSLSDSTDTISLSANPSISNIFYNTTGSLVEIVSDFTLNKAITANNSFVVYGTNFKYTNCILLSTSSLSSLTPTITSLNSPYTGAVSGYVLPLSNFTILNDNMISLDLTKIKGSGEFNIVINNPVGWASTYSINSFTFTKS